MVFNVLQQSTQIVATRVAEKSEKGLLVLQNPQALRLIEAEVHHVLSQRGPLIVPNTPLSEKEFTTVLDEVMRKLVTLPSADISRATTPLAPLSIRSTMSGVDPYQHGSRARQLRSLAADAQWSAKAWDDHMQNIVGSRKDLENRRLKMQQQAEFLGRQVSERKEEEMKRQRELVKLGEEIRASVEQHKEEEFKHKVEQKTVMKTEWSGLIQRAEHASLQRSIEKSKQLKLEQEQFRQVQREMKEEEEKRQREREQAKKEFEVVLAEAKQRSMERQEAKQEEARMDKYYQKLYEQTLDNQAANRSNAAKKLQEKMMSIQNKANKVQNAIKEQQEEHDAKIEAEYQAQMRAREEREMNEIKGRKKRNLDTLNTIQTQVSQKEQERQRALQMEREYNRQMDKIVNDSMKREYMKRMQARQEEMRRTQFLDSQVRLRYLRETMPLETQIMRPQPGTPSPVMTSALVHQSPGLVSLSRLSNATT